MAYDAPLVQDQHTPIQVACEEGQHDVCTPIDGRKFRQPVKRMVDVLPEKLQGDDDDVFNKQGHANEIPEVSKSPSWIPWRFMLVQNGATGLAIHVVSNFTKKLHLFNLKIRKPST